MEMNKIAVITIAILFLSPFISANGNERSYTKTINNVLYVGGSGPNNYTSIQAAINDASNGYTIYVYPRQYNESIVINKSISLIGIIENGEKPIIDGNKNKSTVLIEANKTTVKNFIVMHGRGLAIKNSNDCKIENNEISFSEGNGLSLYKSFHILVRGNIVSRNKNEGIHVSRSSNNIIEENIVKENAGTGIVVFAYSSNNTVSYNNVTGNFHGMEIGEAAYNCTVSFNHAYKNYGDGINMDGCKNVSVKNNKLHDNSVAGIQMMDCQYCLVEKNELDRNDAGILLEGTHGVNYKGSLENIFKYNNISSNSVGIYLESSCRKNIIEYNNFNNHLNAYFWLSRWFFEQPYHNTWYANYWSSWHLPTPKPIKGVLNIIIRPPFDLPWFSFSIYWLNFDFHPALHPYKI